MLASAAAALAGSLVRGADSNVGVTMRPVVSEEASPMIVFEAPTPDNQKATAVVRIPPGEGRLPAVIVLHGGLESRPVDGLKIMARSQPTLCRLLAAGYVTVTATFRSRQDDPQTRDALVDCLAIVDYVKKMPRVDPKSVVIFGGSGGGSLGMELAGETELCVVAAGEPANVLFTGVLNKENRNLEDIMNNPRKYYTPELQRFTEEKIKKINCPVMIVHSNVHAINKINDEIVLPAMRDAGKYYEVVFFPGMPHGFYNGFQSGEIGVKAYDAVACFYSRHVPTKPVPLDKSLIRWEPIPSANSRDAADGDPAAQKARPAGRGERAKKK